SGSRFLPSAGWFLAGVLLAGAAAWFSRTLWTPPPVVFKPRVLIAGNNAGPYTSIAAAMAEARPGDTVEVLGGEYREQVTLKNGVTLRSRQPRAAILRAAALSTGPAVQAENVRDAR